MNKQKININKKSISIIVLAIVTMVFVYAVYIINDKIRSYRSDVLGDYTKLAELESEKKILDVYNKILLKGSKESIEIKKHILTNDRKIVLGLINEIENYTKKSGLTENGASPIVSVSTRENALLTKYNGVDLVINIRVVGAEKSIDNFINILDNLPLISYIEKIDTKFDSMINKNSATIVLVIYQKNEVK